MTESQIPKVHILDSIQPNNIGAGDPVLHYSELQENSILYRHSFPERSAKVWDAAPGSVEELTAVRELALEYLLHTADKLLQTPAMGDRELWATRFTEASIELYGQPLHSIVHKGISDEFNYLKSLPADMAVDHTLVDVLLHSYRPMLDRAGTVDTNAPESLEAAESLRVYGDTLKLKYGRVYDLVRQMGFAQFGPDELNSLFSAAFGIMAEIDGPDWHTWETVRRPVPSLMVWKQKRRIRIGDQREVADPIDAVNLLAHELHVHAVRANNGHRLGDDQLVNGLGEATDAEEGLAIFSSQAVTGTRPTLAYDRYIDIGLALGQIDGRKIGRRALFEISYARRALRAQLEGRFDQNTGGKLERQAWTHIDRIFRGTPGDDQGSVYGVFTKDIAYYAGYLKISNYITEKLHAGVRPELLLEYLSAGKFDPTIPLHAKYVSQKTGIEI